MKTRHQSNGFLKWTKFWSLKIIDWQIVEDQIIRDRLRLVLE